MEETIVERDEETRLKMYQDIEKCERLHSVLLVKYLTGSMRGFAQYAEGEMDEYQRQALDDAIKGDELLSVRSLGSSFPTDPNQASLAYAQSLSLVSFLIDNYDWAKMQELLAIFKEGSTYDNALIEVYRFDTNGLEEWWCAHIGAS